MVKFPNGQPTPHITASTGPDLDYMDFYRTEYSRNQGTKGFLPRIGKHQGTGYQSNFRPGVYYTRKLDELDNPCIGQLLKDNYNTTTKDSYQGYKGSDGTDPFAREITDRNTGFNSNQQITRGSYIVKSAPPALLGNRPERDDRVSENHAEFVRKSPLVGTQGKSVGRHREETGFTHAKNIEPITYRADECHHGSDYMNYVRPTGTSIMKNSYLPSQHPRGDEKFNHLNEKAEKDNGFTRFIRPTAALTSLSNAKHTTLDDLHPLLQKRIVKTDPAELVNLTHVSPYTTMKQAAYQGKQTLKEPFIANKSTQQIGEKEGSGFTANNKDEGCLPDSDVNHSTVYKEQFYDKNIGPAGNPFTIDVKVPVGDGYTKNEQVHGSGTCEEKIKAELHPYVVRSLKARDPFYGDNIHGHKKIALKC